MNDDPLLRCVAVMLVVCGGFTLLLLIAGGSWYCSKSPLPIPIAITAFGSALGASLMATARRP